MDKKILLKLRLDYPNLDDISREKMHLFQRLNNGKISISETSRLAFLVELRDKKLSTNHLKNKRQSNISREIDWFAVGNFLKAQCSVEQIAASFNIPLEILYDRCQQELGVQFTTYAQKQKALGCISIHLKQYELAMKGNVSMLIWWGKQYLGQSEKPKALETQHVCQRVILVSPPDGN